MPVEVDFPLPEANVTSTFSVGGTYDATGRNGATTSVLATLYQSDGKTVIASATASGLKTNTTGPWSVSLTDPAPPHTGCILEAVLAFDGTTNQVDGINVQAATGWVTVVG